MSEESAKGPSEGEELSEESLDQVSGGTIRTSSGIMMTFVDGDGSKQKTETTEEKSSEPSETPGVIQTSTGINFSFDDP